MFKIWGFISFYVYMYLNLEMLVWLFDFGDFGLVIFLFVVEGIFINLGEKVWILII